MIAILLLSLLDFLPSRTADVPHKKFRIAEFEEPATGNCSMNPSNGGMNDAVLEQIPLLHEPQWETSQTTIFTDSVHASNSERMVPRMPSVFPPEPPQPPVITPEPPVLFMVLLGLFFLLFAFRQRIKF